MEMMVDITDSNLYFFKDYQTGEITGELWVNGSLFYRWKYDDMREGMKNLANQTFDEIDEENEKDI